MQRATQPAVTLVQYPGLRRDTTLSPPCGKVHMALRFKGLAYEIRNANAPWEVRRYNPRGRVPVLLLDGTSVADSTDILTRLEERFPTPPLEPSGAKARAQAKLLEDWADEVLYFYGVYTRWIVPENFARMRREVLSRLPVPMRWIVPSVAKRTVRRRAAGQGIGVKPAGVVEREMRDCFAALRELIGDSGFLVGDGPTRADLAVAAVLDQMMVERLTPRVAAELREDRAIVSWLERVHRVAPNAAESPGA